MALSLKGWTDSQLGLIWLKEHFDKLTASKKFREYRIFILDGHDSHCTLELLRLLRILSYCS